MPHPLPPSFKRDVLRLAALQALAIPLVGGFAFMFSPQPGGWLLGSLAGVIRPCSFMAFTAA